MGFTTGAKNSMLDALLPTKIRLHSGDPGGSGTSNALGAGTSDATFSAASGGERVLASDVSVTDLAANQSVTYFSVWAGSTFLGSAALSGDNAANADGDFILKATTTKLSIT